MSHARIAGLALAVGVVAISGCGGSTNSTTQASSSGANTYKTTPKSPSPSGQTLSRSALIAKADPICYNVNLVRASIKLGSAHSSREIARLILPLAEREQKAIVELSKLVPPASMANDWHRIVLAAKTVANGTAELSRQAGAGKGFKLSPELSNAQKQLTSTAQRNGFTDCART